jgi:nitrate reductase gamma subunit
MRTRRDNEGWGQEGAEGEESAETAIVEESAIMNTWGYLIAGVLPYLVAAVFVAGVGGRLLAWSRAPAPPPMTLFPTRGASTGALLEEAFFLPRLWRGDRTLWLCAWAFHAALALVLAGHVRVVSALFDRGLDWAGLGAGTMSSVATVAGAGAGLVLLAALLLLLGRRMVVRRVREISGLPDYFALFLLVTVVGTGDWMRICATPIDLAATRAWVAALVTMAPAPALPTPVLAHLGAAEALVLYVAFSKLMHFGGIFFALPLVKRGAP